MKTISLMEFGRRAKEISEKTTQKYKHYKVYVTFDPLNGLVFQLYIAGSAIVEGKSPEECLSKMRELIWPKKSNIEDVVIELEEQP